MAAGGAALLKELERLQADVSSKGYKAFTCIEYHFLKTVRIENRAKGLILLPVKGNSTLIPGGPVVSEPYLYIEDVRFLKPDADGMDMILIVLEGPCEDEGQIREAIAQSDGPVE